MAGVPDRQLLTAMRPLLERLEELAVDAGLTGLDGTGEEMARAFDGLSDLLGKSSTGERVAQVPARAATLIRRILSREAPSPRGFTEQLLETLSALSGFAAGADVAGRLEALSRALVPAPLSPAAASAVPAPDVGKLFLVEAVSCVDRVESALLELEKQALDEEALRDLARDLHNLKGSAGMSGFEEVVVVAHAMENRVLGLATDPDADRSGVVDGLLRGLDDMREAISRIRTSQASETSEATAPGAPRNYLVFDVGGRRLAVALSDVALVGHPPPPTPVPFQPRFVLGLVNLEGELMPLIDLAERLGLAGATEEPQWILVVGQEGERMALRVRGVAEIVSVPPERLASSETGPGELPWTADVPGVGPVPVLDSYLLLSGRGSC